MRKKLLVISGLFALVGTIAVAAVLGIAGVGKAASTNTCAYTAPGPPPSEPNCFNVVVDPIYVNTTQAGLVTAKFKNVFGSATATHTVITIFLPDNTSANAVSAAGATCSQTADNRTVSCEFGSVLRGGTAKMVVKFTSTAPVGAVPIQVSGVLSYAEGNGTNGNDAFTDFGSFLSVGGDGTNKAGYCTMSATKTVKNKPVPLASTVDAQGQTSTIESLAGLAGGLCTPISAGVENPRPQDAFPVGPIKTHVSVVAFPATGTVTILFPVSFGAGDASAFILRELSIDNGVDWIPVERCTDPPPFATGTDSCIVSQTNVTKNGVKYVQDVLTVVGSPPDGHYGG